VHDVGATDTPRYKQIAKEMVLHMMLPPPPARTVIRRDYLLRSAEGEKVVAG
jgi:hypothetical protein